MPSLIDEIVREGARRMLVQAPQAGVDACIAAHAAGRDMLAEIREGRCWLHKTANVLAALPKSAHLDAEKALAEIWGSEDKEHARAARAFDAAYGAKFPKAAAKITYDLDQLLAFYGFPAERWVHLRITNPIVPPSPRSGTGPHLVALVRARATFINGKLAERPDDLQAPAAHDKAA